MPLYHVINRHKYNCKNNDSSRSREETDDTCDSVADSSENRIGGICDRISNIRTAEAERHPQNHTGNLSKIHP